MFLFQPLTPASEPLIGPHDIVLAASSNITASGENTTAQLTAPSGKTSGVDFQAGRIQDDENPADSVDLGIGKYGEFEYSIKAANHVANSDVYYFRIVDEFGNVLDTYTNTPQWTVQSGLSATIGLQTETDSLLAVGKQKVKTIGILTETDTAQTATRVKRATAGLLSETDSPQSLARVKRKALGIPSETDSLFTVGKVKRKATGLITETDALLTPNRAKNRALGILSETDTLFIYGRVKSKATGLLSETDSLLPFTVPGDIVLGIGLQTETDSLLPFTKFKRAGLGIQTEADSLLPFGRVKRKSIGILVETDSLLPAGKAKVKALGLLSESDSLLTALRIKRMGVGILSETDSLLGVVFDTGLILRELLLYPRSAALALDERGAEYTLPQRDWFALAERDGATELQNRSGAMNLEELEQ